MPYDEVKAHCAARRTAVLGVLRRAHAEGRVAERSEIVEVERAFGSRAPGHAAVTDLQALVGAGLALCWREHGHKLVYGIERPAVLVDPESLRVSRDPCSFCGVRGDVGCDHRRVAA